MTDEDEDLSIYLLRLARSSRSDAVGRIAAAAAAHTRSLREAAVLLERTAETLGLGEPLWVEDRLRDAARVLRYEKAAG